MKIKFLGSRGSIPTPGSQFAEYGGNTSCIQIIDHEDNYIILDAGSGIKNLNKYALEAKKKESIILLTHFHWDHIIGIPFFIPFYSKDFKFTIYGPKESSTEMYNTINNILAKDYFPINLEQFAAHLEFEDFYEGKVINYHNMKIEALWTNHSCYTLSYKITYNNKVVVYLTDHEPYKKRLHIVHPSIQHLNANLLHARLIDYIRGADILIVEGEYTKKEYESHIGWGHSTFNDSIQLAIDANIPYVVIHHHNQDRTDEQLKLIHHKFLAYIKKENINIKLAFAKENTFIEL